MLRIRLQFWQFGAANCRTVQEAGPYGLKRFLRFKLQFISVRLGFHNHFYM